MRFFSRNRKEQRIPVGVNSCDNEFIAHLRKTVKFTSSLPNEQYYPAPI